MNNNYLIVVDMQKDFIDQALGTKEAVSIVDNVVNLVKDFAGEVIFTRDTHKENYMDTFEGKNLPVPHCIFNTEGWEICDELKPYVKRVIDKPTFGSVDLMEVLKKENKVNPISSITLVGLCTDICVISNTLLIKAALPEVEIIVDASCCAGVSVESHKNALNAMKMCHIKIINE